MKRITIEPVIRIEGHAKITIQLDDQGLVVGTEFHVTQVRGFEKFTEGRPFYEMPGITARICGIRPISHLLAPSKACDAIMAVRVPPAARKLVHFAADRAVACLEFLLPVGAGFPSWNGLRPCGAKCSWRDCKPPGMARDGIDLRKFGLWKAWRKNACIRHGSYPAA